MSTLNQIDLTKPVNFAQLEEQVLDYWDRIDAFNRSVQQRPQDKPFVFYDGPPFATGLPHYGHLLSSVMKDIIPRYQTMKGHRVERVWGWDCHGLPIENIIEQELGLKGGKKGIEAYGIDKFNAACRSAILRFDQEWEKTIRRIGRWVDFTNSYKTMDTSYMESVWWAFKQLYDQGLVYQGRKVILYCPRCSTPLSNFEIAMDNSYVKVTETSTIYKFPVKNRSNTYLLAWSTTPWNKLVTPALGVNPELDYVKVKQADEHYYLAQSTLGQLEGDYQIIEQLKGKDLTRLEFEMLYDFYPNRQGNKAGVVIADDYVSAEEGTGIVTLAIYGEEDYRVMQAHDVQLIEHVDEAGKLKPEVTPWAGMYILEANLLIDQDLEKRGLIYAHKPYTHTIPTCYRCGTRLYYAPVPAWFIKIQKLKPDLITNNRDINWYPAHLKAGRFGKGLETAPDWNISRSRYWGTPMPVWVPETLIPNTPIQPKVIGSIEELKKEAVDPQQVEGLTDIHREKVDPIKVWVEYGGKKVPGVRIPEVFDCWIESGSMSFAQIHYPFENQDRFDSRFPADYIVEYIAQTRAWFYTMHVMSTALFNRPAFQNALTTGTIMAQDGTKMSKSKKNFPDPMIIIDRYGVDSLRLYFASSPVMKTAQNVNFNPDSINEIRKKTLNILWNVFKFYSLFHNSQDNYGYPDDPRHVMDKWLMSITQNLNQTVTLSLDHYDVFTASRALMDYIQDLSTWYLRRSRDRLRDSDPQSLQVFRTALRDYCLLLAPFAPFITEVIYQNLPGDKLDSIHLELLPQPNADLVHPQLESRMKEARAAVEKAHAARKAAGIKTRQPLSQLTITSTLRSPKSNLLEVIAQEVNVKQVKWQEGQELTVKLDTSITPTLKAEGEARELVRAIQDRRKKMGLSVDQPINVILPSWPKDHASWIKQKVLAQSLTKGPQLQVVLAE